MSAVKNIFLKIFKTDNEKRFEKLKAEYDAGKVLKVEKGENNYDKQTL